MPEQVRALEAALLHVEEIDSEPLGSQGSPTVRAKWPNSAGRSMVPLSARLVSRRVRW